jgi:hypothetical protein
MKTLVKGTAKEAAKVKIHNDLANAAFFYKNIIVEKTCWRLTGKIGPDRTEPKTIRSISPRRFRVCS